MNAITITNKADVFCVQTGFVDKYIKDANPSFIKVYLYVARHSQSGEVISLGKIADDTGLLKSDVVAALSFWQNAGAIAYTDSSIEILPLSQKSAPLAAAAETNSSPKGAMAQPNSSVASSYKASGVIKAVISDEKLSHLFAIISQLLNKTLSPNDYKIIYSFIDYLKLPEQVIIVLFEHCVSLGKTHMRYIEKVAYSWADSGITTPERAIEYVRKQNDENSTLTYYRKKFKITGRDFADTEVKYILSWINDLKADEELIMYAYDKTVMNTGVVKMSYMDAIIRNELASPRGAQKDECNAPNVRKSTFRNYPTGGVGEIEKQMIEKMMSEFGGNDDAINQ
ncbi:MAG: DnaD domain protein [Clostridia bacterium]|nr:DnaD domain protein [Clostridia bacterium]